MKNLLRAALPGLLASLLLTPAAVAQTAGRLRYEATRRLDMSKVKMIGVNSNGQPMDLSGANVQLSGPGGSFELPSTTGYTMSLLYKGAFAKEEQDSPGTQVMLFGGGAGTGAGRAPKIEPPYTERKYLNLSERTVTSVLTTGGTSYALPSQPVPGQPTSWQDWPQTRKIAGYACHKVTVPFKQETYTLWVTTELPFTYSPVRELTPARGVVLALSSDQEQYTATRLTAEAVADDAVRPSAQAKPVTEAQLKELRAKAEADMHQHLLEQLTGSQH